MWSPEVISAVSWEPLVLPADVTKVVARAQSEWPSFSLFEKTSTGVKVPVAPRSFYVPVMYIEPVAPNRAAVGFDLHSEPARASALAKAMTTGMATATSRLVLVQLPGCFASLVFTPLYRAADGFLDTQLNASQVQTVDGFISGVFVFQQILAKALQNINIPARVDVLIFDNDAVAGSAYLSHYCSPSSDTCPYSFAASSGLMVGDIAFDVSRSLPFIFGGRRLQLVVVGRVGFIASRMSDTPLVMFLVSVAGVVCSFLAAQMWTFMARWRLRRAGQSFRYIFFEARVTPSILPMS